jgi:uncharacterized OsmC-like protein
MQAEMSTGVPKTVELARVGDFRYRITNARGGHLEVGDGDDELFTPVELLLAALCGCGAHDVESSVSELSAVDALRANASGEKITDEQGTRMVNLAVSFDACFPRGEAGDQARASLQGVVQHAQDESCAVGRTVRVGDPVSYRVNSVG